MKQNFLNPRTADFWILSVSSCLLALFAAEEIQYHLHGGSTYFTILYRILLLTVTCALFYLGGLLCAQRTGNRCILKRLMLLFFLLYLYLILTFTLIDPTLGRGRGSVYQTEGDQRSYYLRHFVNLRPFRSIYEVYIKGFFKGYLNASHILLNLVGNLCAFMPFAFFLPLLFPKQRKWYCFVPTMLLLVTLIETMQFCFMVGSCDIDDLILNAGGAAVLFFILKIPPFKRIAEKIGGC